jgi:ATP-dependent DNA helicase RecQ
LYKDIETYGIVKITDKGLSFINKPSSLMSEDHQYNEAGDHAIVSASKSSGAIDEVLMVCYVICVKEYLKN